MTRDIRDFLEDILGHTANAQKLVASTKLSDLSDQFSSEGLALQRSMEIIGEAVKQIPDEIRIQYPNIPWRSIAGLRDVLSHRYWDMPTCNDL